MEGDPIPFQSFGIGLGESQIEGEIPGGPESPWTLTQLV